MEYASFPGICGQPKPVSGEVGFVGLSIGFDHAHPANVNKFGTHERPGNATYVIIVFTSNPW